MRTSWIAAGALFLAFSASTTASASSGTYTLSGTTDTGRSTGTIRLTVNRFAGRFEFSRTDSFGRMWTSSEVIRTTFNRYRVVYRPFDTYTTGYSRALTYGRAFTSSGRQTFVATYRISASGRVHETIRNQSLGGGVAWRYQENTGWRLGGTFYNSYDSWNDTYSNVHYGATGLYDYNTSPYTSYYNDYHSPTYYDTNSSYRYGYDNYYSPTTSTYSSYQPYHSSNYYNDYSTTAGIRFSIRFGRRYDDGLGAYYR